MARHPMTALSPSATRKVRDRSTGRLTTFLAESADGVWTYIREDDAQTTWTVRHNPTNRTLEREPNLAVARRGTASGYTLNELDRIYAARTMTTAQRARLTDLRELSGIGPLSSYYDRQELARLEALAREDAHAMALVENESRANIGATSLAKAS